CPFLVILLTGFMGLVPGSRDVHGQPISDDDTIYIVQPGDHLVKIAAHFGSPDFWRLIYEANRDKIENPCLIQPGLELVIPEGVIQSEKYTGDYGSRPTAGEEQEKDQEKLEDFRKAFNNLVSQEEVKKPAPVDNGLEFGGLIINETRSKLGKDFFHVFYQFWEEPEESPNFLLTITERPVPGMGTMVSVNLDNQPIYRSRLQPRSAVIERQALQAVQITNRKLVHGIQIMSEINIY